MAIEIFMPALSPTMEKGTLATWLVKEGDKIESGDVLAEIETDKATMEVESIDEGVIAKIFVEAGTDDVPVGTLIAIMAEEGEDVGDVSAKAPAASVTPVPVVAVETAPAVVVSPAPAPQNAVPQAAAPRVEVQTGDRIKASPLAKRIASQEGVDIAQIAGSGPKGRIIKRDVEAAIAAGTETVSSATTPTAATTSTSVATTQYGPHDDIPYHEERLSGMRKTIAKRLTESKTTVPHFYLTVDCEVDNLLTLRKELNGKAAEGVKVSVNDFVIRAAALALKKVPAANVQFAGDTMYWYERADISVAVAIDGGLITPVVRGACSKGLGDISTEVRELAAKARDGKLLPEEYAGGTFSISNLGMFGIKEFSAVINPPQGAILAIGAGEQRPVVKDGALAVATVMSCTLSCDHRAIDGSVGAEFLAEFKKLIQDPVTMLL